MTFQKIFGLFWIEKNQNNETKVITLVLTKNLGLDPFPQ